MSLRRFVFFCTCFKFLRYLSDSFTRFSSATTPSCLFYVLLNCLCFSIITIINNFTELITIFAFNCNCPFISIDFSAIVTQEQCKAIIQEKVTQQTADVILITWVCFEKQNPAESVKIDSCKRENAFLIFPGLFDKLADIKLTYRVKITSLELFIIILFLSLHFFSSDIRHVDRLFLEITYFRPNTLLAHSFVGTGKLRLSFGLFITCARSNFFLGGLVLVKWRVNSDVLFCNLNCFLS